MSGKSRSHKHYSREFKEQAAKLVVEEGLSRRKVATDLSVSPSIVGKWVKDFQTNPDEAFPGKGFLAGSERRIKELENENRQLKMERDILKKATAFFANQGR